MQARFGGYTYIVLCVLRGWVGSKESPPFRVGRAVNL